MQSISYALATVWTYRSCLASEALVVLSPEHAQTIHRAGWSKQNARDFLFENTGVPLRAYLTLVAGDKADQESAEAKAVVHVQRQHRHGETDDQEGHQYDAHDRQQGRHSWRGRIVLVIQP